MIAMLISIIGMWFCIGMAFLAIKKNKAIKFAIFMKKGVFAMLTKNIKYPYVKFIFDVVCAIVSFVLKLIKKENKF